MKHRADDCKGAAVCEECAAALARRLEWRRADERIAATMRRFDGDEEMKR